MRRVSSISRATLVLLLLGLCCPPGHADPKGKSDGCLKDPVCHEHYEQALSQYDAGRYDDALAGFQAAYARRQMPWLLINIGRAVQRLGRPQEAINYYERYKKAEPNIDPEAEKRVNKYIEQARALLEQTPEQPNLPIPPKPEPTPPPTGTLTASPSPTAPTPPPPPAATVHLNKTEAVAAGELKVYTVDVTAGKKILVRTTSQKDVDLYIQMNAAPTTAAYLMRGYTSSGNETIAYTPTSNGTLQIGVHGYAASTFTLKTANN